MKAAVNKTIEAVALDYVQRGWKPVPVSRKTKKPIDKGWQKRPFAPGQFNGNGQNIGVQFGEVSGGLVDVDLDSTLAIGLAPEFLPPTDAIFGRRSRPCSHQLYFSDLHKTEKSAAIQFKEYIDGRPGPCIVELRIGAADKGAVSVFPPSMHETGEMVQWACEGEPAPVAGADLKRAVLKLAIACLLKPRYPGQGSRHEGALVLGGVLARAGWNTDNIEHLIEVLARAAGDDEWRDRVTAATGAVSVKANGRDVAGLERLRVVWGPEVASTLAKWLTLRAIPDVEGAGLEDSIALEFAEQHANDFRFVAMWNKWMKYDGARWQAEDTLCAFDESRKLCRKAGEARAKTVAAIITLARSDRRLAATTDQWDADIWTLGTPSGAIDLRTGKIRPASPEDYITKITTVAPSGDCPLWREFLARVTGNVTGNDAEMQDYLQRICGYALTGDTSEDALFFLYGSGANGKSVFIKTIAGILGDHHTTASMETFTTSHNERHPTDLADLRGARLVTATETEEGKRWDEVKIKALTGGDRIKARFMRQDFFEYTPRFKLIIAGNHRPGIRTVDEAIRRRMNLIPFTVTIPREERDLDLADKLKAEWPGILAWMVEGCLAWQGQGLRPPKAVLEATESYLAAEDALRIWIDECCVTGPNLSDSIGNLWNGWKTWAEKAGEYVGSKRKFGQKLEDKGYSRTRDKKARCHIGLQFTGDAVDR